MSFESHVSIKIRGVTKDAVQAAILSRHQEIFGRASLRHDKAGNNVMTGGARLAPYGFKSNIRFEELPDNAILVTADYKLRLKLVGLLATTLAFVFMLGALNFPMLFVFGGGAAILLVIGMAGARRSMNKKISEAVRDTQTRFV